jgi:cytochrome c-type biogenesis protein CcmH/NrfF
MTKRRALTTALTLALAASSLSGFYAPLRARQQSTDRTRAIGKKLKCMCGACQDTAATCSHPGSTFSGPCLASAKGMLETINQHIAKGESDDLILQSFVQQYGPEVLIEPPADSAIGRVAWAMPAVYLLLGTVLVIFVISRWRKRAKQTVPGGPAVHAISREALEQARRRVAQETED